MVSGRVLFTLAVVALAALARATLADAHALHTTLTELSSVSPDGEMTIVVRAFADDFGAAALQRARSPVTASGEIPDRVAAAYVASTLTLRDDSGAPLAMRWYGSRRRGDVIWISVRATAPRGALRIRNTMLFERYADQVNIVQGTLRGARVSTLFVKGDGEKVLR